MRLQWNALQVGARVLVHDDADAALRLEPGIVLMVQPARGSNDLGVRVTGRGGHGGVVRPSRLSVRLDPLDATEGCWRHDAIAAAAGHGLGTAAASAS